MKLYEDKLPAQYTVQHECGHVATISTFARGKKLETILTHTMETPCVNCQKAAAKIAPKIAPAYP